jgi:hypothetical protein
VFRVKRKLQAGVFYDATSTSTCQREPVIAILAASRRRGQIQEGAMSHSSNTRRCRELLVDGLVAMAAIALAALVARPYAGSWNDGSRLATVESLVGRHTWIIDESIFVRVPLPPLPYPVSESALIGHGTQDKLLIDGHYYSDKSPVPAVLLAGFYQLWHWTTGMTARSHPDRFCKSMTLASSGFAYVVAVWCMYRLGRYVGLPFASRMLLTGSFALATVALPYTRQVNNHILLLAVASAITLEVAGLREVTGHDRISWRLFSKLGFLAGLGYTIDLGTGPVLLLGTFVFVVVCSISREPQASAGPRARLRLAAKRIGVFILAAIPWLLLHHALNYAIGGTFEPANANPEYFRWPGSPFAARNLTGSWIHPNLGSFLLYAASMIGGKRGFLGHNVPLYLILPAVVVLRRQREMRSELLWAVACSVGTWILYASTSNNSSGQCCSIRWFVPLLAPAYFVLALMLRRFPIFRFDLMLLSGWGMLLVLLMRDGPWMGGMVRFFWPIQAAALLSWALCRYLRPPALEVARQHPYTNESGNSSPPGAAAYLLWKTIPSLSGARANTISATSISTCPATSSSSSPV